MTSPRASTGTPPSANIVWDRSRLHHDRAIRNGQAVVATRPRPTSSMGIVARRVNQQRLLAPHNGRPIPKSPESELTMSFDPMKDLHMWTMWRVAVNGRIVDETRKRNRPHTAPSTPSGQAADLEDNPYGRALVKTPLHRFIKVENGSQDIASVMMDPHREGGRHLGTQQFVFYGVPRVVLKKPKQPKQPPVRLP